MPGRIEIVSNEYIVARFEQMRNYIRDAAQTWGRYWGVDLSFQPKYQYREEKDWQLAGYPWDRCSERPAYYFYDKGVVGINLTEMRTYIDDINPSQVDEVDVAAAFTLASLGVVRANTKFAYLFGGNREKLIRIAGQLVGGSETNYGRKMTRSLNQPKTQVGFRGASIVFVMPPEAEITNMEIGIGINETLVIELSAPIAALALSKVIDPSTEIDRLVRASGKGLEAIYKIPLLDERVTEAAFQGVADFVSKNPRSRQLYLSSDFLSYYVYAHQQDARYIDIAAALYFDYAERFFNLLLENNEPKLNLVD